MASGLAFLLLLSDQDSLRPSQIHNSRYGFEQGLSAYDVGRPHLKEVISRSRCGQKQCLSVYDVAPVYGSSIANEGSVWHFGIASPPHFLAPIWTT